MNYRLFLLLILANIEISAMDYSSLLQHENQAGCAENDIRDEHGRTPLMNAARNGSVVRIEALVASGLIVNAQDNDGKTALMHAITTSREGTIRSVVRELLAVPGIDLSIQDKEGFTVLEIVKKHEKVKIYSGYVYQEVGRMLLSHLRLYSAHGRVAKRGLQGCGLPLDVLKYIATQIDYEEAAKEFKG